MVARKFARDAKPNGGCSGPQGMRPTTAMPPRLIPFTGFPKTTTSFLKRLHRFNDREWFAKHRDEYEEVVLAPALQFIDTMREPMRSISKHFEVAAEISGGSLTRIQRDLRFAKDGKPYKTHIGILFRHTGAPRATAPAFAVKIESQRVAIQVGQPFPDAQALTWMRERIADDEDGWKSVTRTPGFRKRFAFEGEQLKRPLRGTSPDHPFAEDLRRKCFVAVQTFDPHVIETKSFVQRAARSMQAAGSFMSYLCSTLDLDFEA